MKNKFLLILFCLIIVASCSKKNDYTGSLKVISEFTLLKNTGGLRAVPVKLNGDESHILFVFSEDKDIDPALDMFFLPTGTLKLALYSTNGKELWKKDLGKGVIPGVWFCPVFVFDLDNDGNEEIWFVNNTDILHPFSAKSYVLERLDPLTGESTGSVSWPVPYKEQAFSRYFRNFILGGYVKDKPVLITAQGTYYEMKLQAWNQDLTKRWELIIPDDGNGARGSHQTVVADINKDGSDEIMWGERCISIDSGKQLFICDSSYHGHSDVVQPVFSSADSSWYIYTCRESHTEAKPRIVTFNSRGEKVWGDIESGHIDIGWVAKIRKDKNPVAMGVKIDNKIAGPDGFFRSGTKEYFYDVFTGVRDSLPFSAFSTLPADIDGDGIHELISARGEQGDGKVYNAEGQILGDLGREARLVHASRFMDLGGEQLICLYPGGKVKIWADVDAAGSPQFERRYKNSFYKLNQKLTATGYNLINLGGI
ncbi:MAG: rhamnogalacturonan lyase family protein [Bacteroidales bacterium]